MCNQFARQLDKKGKYFSYLLHTGIIKFAPSNSRMKVIATNLKALDGFNASFAIQDEYHSAPNSQIRDVIRSSMGMRTNPHLMTITTAGFDKSLPCYQLRCSCIDILN
jgi:phage terminase large subunit-like protein